MVRTHCDLSGCKEPIAYWLILATDNEVDCDSEGYIKRGYRKKALCHLHGLELWHDAITDVYNWE